MALSEDLRNRIKSLNPWMTDGLLDAYTTEWGISASDDLALQTVRQTTEYQQMFQGNIDPKSGMARMTESEYMASKASFDATLVGMDLNPSYFADDFVTALNNEISPREFIGRMESAYERIIQSTDAIKEYYSENYGIDMTDAAIFASAINPTIGNEILNRKISVAEIGGEAAARGFDVSIGFGEQLAQAGIDRQSAGQFFGSASDLIPAMQTLAARHGDPDDEFDLNDVSAAFLFDDPKTRRRIRRAQAQEASSFTGGATTDFRRTQSGGVAGLAQG